MWWKIKLIFILFVKVAFADLESIDDLVGLEAYKLRLVGRSVLSGRLEVFYKESWGTVCDDGFTNATCALVCKHLGYQNGTCLTHDKTHTKCVLDTKQIYEEGTGNIWLDDMQCMSYEHHLHECPHSPWGDVNCNHTEDVGCSCLAENKCDRNRHRIRPLNPSIRGVGIVEIKNDEGEWGGVCDDHWEDIDAAVFCRCLGYENEKSFKAMLMSPKQDISNSVLSSYNKSIVIDHIHCRQKDKDLYSNLYDCANTVFIPSKCNVKTELAIVRCENASTPFNFTEAIQPNIECHKDSMKMCIQPISPFSPAKSFAQLVPSCEHAIQLDYDPDKGFCYDINFNFCQSLDLKEDTGSFETCFDLKFHTVNHPFFFIEPPSYRGCCIMQTDKEVETHVVGTINYHKLTPSTTNSPDLIKDSIEPSIRLACSDKDFESVEFQSQSSLNIKPVQMKTGSPIYCKVKAEVWHEYSYLVVNNCRLDSLSSNQAKLRHNNSNNTTDKDTNNTNNKYTNNNDTNIRNTNGKDSNDNSSEHHVEDDSYVVDDIKDQKYFGVNDRDVSFSDEFITYRYVFYANKCPVTDLLNMELYNFDSLEWGFSIYLPKYKNHNNVHISCDASLCDLERNEKRVCDRSCDPSADVNGGADDGGDDDYGDDGGDDDDGGADGVTPNMDKVVVISRDVFNHYGSSSHEVTPNTRVQEMSSIMRGDLSDNDDKDDDDKDDDDKDDDDKDDDDKEDDDKDDDDKKVIKDEDNYEEYLVKEGEDENQYVRVVKRSINKVKSDGEIDDKYYGILTGKNRFNEIWGDDLGMVIKKRGVKKTDEHVRRKKNKGEAVKRKLKKSQERKLRNKYDEDGFDNGLNSVVSKSDDDLKLKTNTKEGMKGADNLYENGKEKKLSESDVKMIEVVSPMIEFLG